MVVFSFVRSRIMILSLIWQIESQYARYVSQRFLSRRENLIQGNFHLEWTWMSILIRITASSSIKNSYIIITEPAWYRAVPDPHNLCSLYVLSEDIYIRAHTHRKRVSFIVIYALHEVENSISYLRLFLIAFIIYCSAKTPEGWRVPQQGDIVLDAVGL